MIFKIISKFYFSFLGKIGFNKLISGLFTFFSQTFDNFSLKYGFIALAFAGIIYLFIFKKTFSILKIKGNKIMIICQLWKIILLMKVI